LSDHFLELSYLVGETWVVYDYLVDDVLEQGRLAIRALNVCDLTIEEDFDLEAICLSLRGPTVEVVSNG